MSSRQLFIGLISEGSTDTRFLYSVIERTIKQIIFDFGGVTEISIEELKKDFGKNFSNQVIDANLNYQKESLINILLVHSDADHKDDSKVLNEKFIPLFENIKLNDEVMCKEIVPVIPVYMIESWMLADIDLFLDEISTNKTKSELGLNGNPERFTNPKNKIKEALHIINQEKPKKRRKDLQINDLYQIIGQKIEIDKLINLNSFDKFYKQVSESLQKLNYINKKL
ncbi:DUF4276 family protein [Chryseobacterium taihuense]|uniref:DUF4276 family protein n=1 Tax=Chryseobacterium taihuense TaxID=1141221 RepID=A0ABY0QSZ0_9FLAO|nr:DUF4276 family protein [Chryseobacterium taihuense]SDL79457.1 protein of unknown function [Chryseobacterium taihuense]